MLDVRPSPIVGRWYPGEAVELAAQVDGYLAAAGAGPAPTAVMGLLAPHAGLLYSGRVAAYAFQAVRGVTVDVVVILSPSHFHADGPLLTSRHAAYETPLGVVPVAQDLGADLRARLADALGAPSEKIMPALRRDREHAIEIELPFLQRVLTPGFQMLPVMLRDQSAPMARALGAAVAETVAGRSALIVASSDLSHHQPQAEALRLDRELLRQVEACDPEEVLEAQAAGRGRACGAGAVAAALWAVQPRGATAARVLRHATSGDVSGDYSAVVGYAAAVFTR